MNLGNMVDKPVTKTQHIFQRLLGAILIIAGVSHQTFARKAFRAQVPDWVPLSKDLTVVLSGIVEITLGMALAFWITKRVFWGWIAAVFFILIFPGNIAQLANHRDAFGLDTDAKRVARLVFQPLLVAWALWSTGAWAAWRLSK